MIVAFFTDEDSFNDNIGEALLVHIGAPITKATTMQSLLDGHHVQAFYWDFGQQDDINIPSCRFARLIGRDPTEKALGLAMMNHVDSPYLYGVQNKKMTEAYEILSLNKQPHVVRPDGLEARETLGCCLGFCLMQTNLGTPDKIEI